MDYLPIDQNENLELNNAKQEDEEKACVRDYLDIFILSESGKPIYCHNKRDDETTLLPLCQALVNYFCNTQTDTLKYVLFKSGLKVTFSVKSPLILIVVNHQYSGLDSNLIINQLYAQIISTITNKTLKSVYEQSAKFDLRRLLGNSEKIIEYLIDNGLVAKQLKNLTSKPIKQQNDRQSDSTSLQENNDQNEIYCFLTSVTQSYSNLIRQNAIAISSSTSSNLTSNIYKPHLNRVMIPILAINQPVRDSITNILTSSIASSSNDILYSVLIKFNNDPVTVGEIDNNQNEITNLSQDNGTLSQGHSNFNKENFNSIKENLNSDLENFNLNQEETMDSFQSIANEKNKNSSKLSEDSQKDETKAFNDLKKNEIIDNLNYDENELNEELFTKEFKPTANCHLITIANQNSKIAKLNTLDAHILINLMLVLKNQLNTVESLWLPVCLPRFNNNAFMHAHLCLLNLQINEDGLKNKFGLIQLTTSKEDFDKCQLAKNIINERLNKLTISSIPFSEINIPILHSFWYQSLRSQTIVWKSKYCQNGILCRNDYLINYMAKRMIDSNLKTFWIRSDRHYIALLGSHSPSFQLYIQFDVIATKSHALKLASEIIKWVKKEEDKILIKDYQ